MDGDSDQLILDAVDVVERGVKALEQSVQALRSEAGDGMGQLRGRVRAIEDDLTQLRADIGALKADAEARASEVTTDEFETVEDSGLALAEPDHTVEEVTAAARVSILQALSDSAVNAIESLGIGFRRLMEGSLVHIGAVLLILATLGIGGWTLRDVFKVMHLDVEEMATDAEGSGPGEHDGGTDAFVFDR